MKHPLLILEVSIIIKKMMLNSTFVEQIKNLFHFINHEYVLALPYAKKTVLLYTGHFITELRINNVDMLWTNLKTKKSYKKEKYAVLLSRNV